ncbi:MAG TPA: PHP domain-containing protein [Gaiellaceae bacterium]|nr:PHP domain-containing protein [Gaiellaceae bacterium]
MAAPDNATIAERLEAMAVLLDLAGAGTYSVRAYRRAAELIRSTPAPVVELVRAGRVRELRGIGPSIEARLRELVETGELAELRELERDVLPEIVGFGRLLGLSARRSADWARALGVSTAAEFGEAIRSGALRGVAGVGPVTEAKLLEALDRPAPRPRRGLLLNRSRALTGSIATALGGVPAGDARRFAELAVRLAVVVATDRPREALDRFAALPEIVAVVDREETRALGVTVEGVPIELVAAPPAAFGTALLRATGSEEYVAALEPLPDASDEEGVYRALGLPYLPPELRETPTRAAPPQLVELAEIRGDLHCHTTWSDGRATVREMAEAAIARGYEYVAICDHTPAVGAVPGLDADAIRRQGEEIARLNEELAPFRVLRGAECDILPDGSLDLPDDVLVELDWVQASVHRGQRGSREQLTRRTLAAARHPAVSSISHPQGRILNHRPPNEVDLEAVFAACAETGTAVETNGLPDRIDLAGELVREAIRAGVAITASTDAHSTRGLGNIELAVGTARRGWATAVDVLNTRPLDELLELRRRKPAIRTK